jgi:predicted dienelactone hydrolase
MTHRSSARARLLFGGVVSFLVAACSSDPSPETPADTGDRTEADAPEAEDVATEDTVPPSDTTEPSDTSLQGDASDAHTDAGAVDFTEALGLPGPLSIGFRTEEVTYDPVAADPARTVRLAIWYPSSTTEGRRPRYFIGATSDRAVVDGELLASETPRPVLLYSHGHLGYAEASSRLMEHFASHGWIVIAVNHTGNTSGNFGTPRTTPIYHVRSQDLRTALDHMESLPSSHPLAGAADTARTVSMGHSFGGYSVLSLVGARWDMDRWSEECATFESGFCSTMNAEHEAVFREGQADPRVVAAIPMAAGDFDLYGAEGLGDLNAPVLHVIGTVDDLAIPMWCALQGVPNLRLELIQGGHQAFTDACDLPVGPSLGCDDDQLTVDDAMEVLGRTTLAFACRAVRGCDPAWVETLDAVLAAPVDDDARFLLRGSHPDCPSVPPPPR